MTRIGLIDSSRGLAVILAMLGHSTRQFASQAEGLGAFENLQLVFTRTATPTFMILFGIMIELVYLRKLRDGMTVEQVRTRLISRMITCYLLFVAIALAAMVTGKLLPHDTLEAVLFTGAGRFGNILKIYTGLFLLIILTLPWAIRWGAGFYLALATVAWATKYLFQAVDIPDTHLLHFIFGHSSGFGPSILLGVTLVAYGLAIGETLSGHRRPRTAMLVFAGAFGMLIFGVLSNDPISFVITTITTYRWENAPYYFAYGIVACSLSLAWFALLWRISPSPSARTGRSIGTSLSFERLGCETLFYYGFGNILLNLLPTYTGTSALVGYALIMAFLIVLTAISLSRPALMANANRLFLGLPGRLSDGYHQVVGSTAASLAGRSSK